MERGVFRKDPLGLRCVKYLRDGIWINNASVPEKYSFTMRIGSLIRYACYCLKRQISEYYALSMCMKKLKIPDGKIILFVFRHAMRMLFEKRFHDLFYTIIHLPREIMFLPLDSIMKFQKASLYNIEYVTLDEYCYTVFKNREDIIRFCWTQSGRDKVWLERTHMGQILKLELAHYDLACETLKTTRNTYEGGTVYMLGRKKRKIEQLACEMNPKCTHGDGGECIRCRVMTKDVEENRRILGCHIRDCWGCDFKYHRCGGGGGAGNEYCGLCNEVGDTMECLVDNPFAMDDQCRNCGLKIGCTPDTCTYIPEEDDVCSCMNTGCQLCDACPNCKLPPHCDCILLFSN